MGKIKFELTIDTVTGEFSVVNIDTGEVKSVSFKETKKSVNKKAKKEESSEPTLILEENKYYLNQAAVDLMNIEPGCKIDVKYEKRGKETIPVIGCDDTFGTKQGNKLNKNLSVACRGSKNEELSKYGSEFILVPHETKDGIFVLQNTEFEPALDDTIEKLDSPEEEIELPMDIDLQDLIDDKDSTDTEISSSMFKL